jgi:hypothetical protein
MVGPREGLDDPGNDPPGSGAAERAASAGGRMPGPSHAKVGVAHGLQNGPLDDEEGPGGAPADVSSPAAAMSSESWQVFPSPLERREVPEAPADVSAPAATSLLTKREEGPQSSAVAASREAG